MTPLGFQPADDPLDRVSSLDALLVPCSRQGAPRRSDCPYRTRGTVGRRICRPALPLHHAGAFNLRSHQT
jgi:hypothetical protein